MKTNEGGLAMGIKLIYKKTLAMDLIRMGHDIEFTSRNRNNTRYQVYAFIDTPELRRDMCKITGRKYIEEMERSEI